MRSLDGPRLKLSRADQQIDSLRADLRAALDAHKNEPWLDLKGETHNGQPAITLYVTKLPSFSTDISLTIGEIIHNLRSSLDHLAWALVPASTLRGLTRIQRIGIEFPMVRSRARYQSSVSRRLPDVDSDHLATIERYQPYRRAPAGRAVRILQALSNTDKHRIIVPTLFYPIGFRFNLKFKGAKEGERITRLAPGRRLTVGAPLLTWTFSARPSDVSVDLEVTASPGFPTSVVRPAPGNTFEDVGGTLRVIYNVCDEILSHFEGDP